MNTLESIKDWLTPGGDKKDKIKELKRIDAEISGKLRRQFRELEDALQHRKQQDHG